MNCLSNELPKGLFADDIHQLPTDHVCHLLVESTTPIDRFDVKNLPLTEDLQRPPEVLQISSELPNQPKIHFMHLLCSKRLNIPTPCIKPYQTSSQKGSSRGSL